MSREVRMVPANWQHPKGGNGCKPLFGGSFSERLAEWEEGARKWKEGFISDFKGGWEPKGTRPGTYEGWDGPCPQKKEYMPDWLEVERTHLQMYETCTEGTPISPVKATPEDLARWLADNGASAFGSQTATYEEWLVTCKAGWAPSAVGSPGKGLQSGVAAMKKLKSH